MDDISSELIKTLTTSMDAISKTDNPSDISKIIENLLLKFTKSDYSSLFIFDAKKQVLINMSDKSVLSMIHPIGLLGEAFLTKEAYVHNHIASTKNYVREIDNPGNLKLKSQLIVPIVDDGELVGIVRTSRSIRHSLPFSTMDVKILESMHTFMIKIMHMLSDDKRSERQISISDINENIKDATRVEYASDDALRSFLSSAVHDIRTPANSLYGFLELIEESIKDKRIVGFIRNAKESASFINTLTTSILDQVKDNQIPQLEGKKCINSIKFFSSIADIFTANMLDKNIAYIVFIDPLIPKEIKIDEMKLKRVINNLISNAYKFTPKDKSVNFSVYYDKINEKLKISVADQGIGIEEYKQKDIFKEFEQANDEIYNEYGGTGLGLSISYKYIQELGGELQLLSQVNVGSKFYFSIPVEIVDGESSYSKYMKTDKKINILTDNTRSPDAYNIIEYLAILGIPRGNISITSTMDDNVQYLYCFEHKLSDEIIELAKNKSIKLFILEESLLSLVDSPYGLKSDQIIATRNSYYGDQIYTTAFSKKKKRVLISDDNQINRMLLRSILETEFVDLECCKDGSEALKLLIDSHEKNGYGYDILFIDEHMPEMTGTEVMEKYREYESKFGKTNTYSISITGDPYLSDKQKDLYDDFIKKPFNSTSVRNSIRSVIS